VAAGAILGLDRPRPEAFGRERCGIE
jgi:hypothetical protein